MRFRAQSKSSAAHNWPVTRRSFADRPAYWQIQRVGRSQRAAAYRAALRNIVEAREDLDRFWRAFTISPYGYEYSR